MPADDQSPPDPPVALQPMRRRSSPDADEAVRVSNAIDEELRVSLLLLSHVLSRCSPV